MKIDIPIKRILQILPRDWAAYLMPELEHIDITPLDSSFVPKAESRLDNVSWVNNHTILHIEPNGYFDRAIPARMLRYRADIWELTLSKSMGTPPIVQALLLFFKEHDNSMHHLEDWNGAIKMLDFHYNVVRVWEMDKNVILNNKLVGLYPLLPLAAGNDSASPDAVISEALEAIDTVTDDSIKIDLLATMSVLASEKYSVNFVRKFIRRENFMQWKLIEVFFKDYEEEKKDEWFGKGVTKGQTETLATVALRMIKSGADFHAIENITGLSRQEIQRLQHESQEAYSV